MFGGLEVKETPAPSATSSSNEKNEEDGSKVNSSTNESSGFSFLATTTTTSSSAPVGNIATSEKSIENIVSSVTAPESAVGLSGFSFMSSISSTENNTDATTKTNDGTTTTRSVAAESGTSGFSFMSGAGGNDIDIGNADDSEKIEDEGKDNTNESQSKSENETSMSGFSFMTTLSSTVTKSETKEVSDSSAHANDTMAATAISSSFNFISSASKEAEASTITSSDTITNDNNSQTNQSIFSMLSSNLGPQSSSSSSPAAELTSSKMENSNDNKPSSDSSSNLPWSGLNMKNPSTNTNTKPPLPSMSSSLALAQPPAADIFMQTNPSQPTGSGIVFGGAAKPKTVKKRARGKKIGVGASSVSTATSIISGSSMAVLSEPSSVPTTSPYETATSSQDNSAGAAGAQGEKGDVNVTALLAKKLSEEAEEAANRAEEFISNKLSSTASSSTYVGGRYSGDKTIIEDYGESTSSSAPQSSNNDIASATANTTESEEYQKAKAAAEEAKNITKRGGFMSGGMSSGFGGFFKRGFANGSGSTGGSASSIASIKSNSTHSNIANEKVASAVETKKEWKVPTYGEPNEDTTQEELNTDYSNNEDGSDDDELEREKREEQLRQELEREREENEHRIMEEQLCKQEVIEEEENRRRQQEMEKERVLKEDRKRIAEEEEARKRSPENELKRIIHHFSILSQNTTCSIAELRQERKGLLEKQTTAEKKERLAIQQVVQAEKQQLDAAEKEDFDLADHLASIIEQHQEEQQEKHLILKEINGLIHTLDIKQYEKGQELLSHFKDAHEQLREFLDQQEHSSIRDSSAVMQKFELDTKRLAAESERLTADLKNIERDEDFVEQERTELETAISEQTEDIEVMRDTASLKLKGINNEIEELRKQLAKKEMEAAEVKMELHGHEESIEHIRNTFSRQLTRLSKKEAAVAESRREWEVEDNAYKISRTEHEAEVTAHSEALLAHDNLISKIKSEATMAKKLALVVETDVVSNGNDNDVVVNDEVTMTQAEVLQCEAAADEANEVLVAARAHIDNLVEEISSIDVRIPILEAEKKQAASKRDFKAAGKASKAIKEMIARKQSCEEELNNEAIERQTSAQKEVDETLEVLKKKKSILHEKEKEGGRQRMIFVVKKIVKLEQLREDVCVSNENEDGNSGSISDIGGFVLDSEIAALVAEGEDLDTKFGGWNEIMMEYADVDAENNVNATFKENIEADNVESYEVKNDDIGHKDITKEIIEEKIIHAQLEHQDLIRGSKDGEEGDGDDNDDDTNNEEKKQESLKRYKAIMFEIELMESAIVTAIDEEDYDTAADLDEKILSLKEEQKSLGISENDLRTDESKESSQCTERSYDIVSNNVEETDLNYSDDHDLNGKESEEEENVDIGDDEVQVVDDDSL